MQSENAVLRDLRIPRREHWNECLALGMGHRAGRNPRSGLGLKPDESLADPGPRLQCADLQPAQQGMPRARRLETKQQQKFPVAHAADG